MKKVFLLLTLLLITPFIFALSFLSNPNIVTNPATTDTSIECRWIASGDIIQQNYTWYNGSEATAYTDSDISSPAFLPSGIATRGETWYCSISMTDGSSIIKANDSVEIDNARPSKPTLYLSGINQGNSTIVIEDTTYNFDVNSTDSDGDTITYLEDSDYITINSNTGEFSWTPLYSQSSSNITFTVMDDYSTPEVNILKVKFTIIYINDSPKMTLSNQVATEGTSFNYDVTVTDEENDENNFTMNVTPALPSLILTKKTGFTFNISFNRAGNTPIFTERGNYTVNVTAYDVVNKSRNVTDSFNLEIIPINQQPNIILIPNTSGIQNDLFTIYINSTDDDENDSSSFSISTLNCNIANPWNISTENNSNNGTGMINLTLNNNHVICPNVTIKITDGVGSTNSQNVYFNITNSNDAPTIYNYSEINTNTGGNNLSNLTRAKGARFVYTLNFTDIDLLTYENEVLIVQSNESLIQPDNNGVFNFTVNESHIGNWTVKVNVTDDEGSYDEVIMLITFVNNTVPKINNLSQNTCQEDVACTIYVSATDNDLGENLTFTSNSSILNISFFNETSARAMTTYDNSQVGNYSINITVRDSLGAVSNKIFNFTINNTNDAPIFDGNQDNISDNVSLGLIVETHEYYYVINASDEDLIYNDILTFNFTLLLGNDSVFNMTKTGSNEATINFTPEIGDANNYSVNITITDTANNIVSQIINFTIYPKSSAPIINKIRPYNNGIETIMALGDNSFGNSTKINFTENQTVIFDVNVTDAENDNLTYSWIYDDNSVGSGRPKNITYNFATSGTHTMNVTVQDRFYETVSFSWNITVINNNREPQLINDLENLTGSLQVNGTRTYSTYFNKFDSAQRFYDPDDDTDGNGEIDGNETFNLTISSSSCVDETNVTVATFSINNAGLTVTPVKLGECIMNFNATDDGNQSIISNNITINVSELNPVTEIISSSSSSSSGGSTRTTTVVIPLTQEVDAPAPLKIITPGKVVMYQQKTINIPIILKSNWSETLYGISIFVESNNTGIEMNLSQKTFNTLEPGLSHEVILGVTNFREGGPYEILVTAKVDSPEYVDSEMILINSIEAANDGDTYNTKIAFARDFFNENEECQELNEVLNEAETAANSGNYKEAINYVDSAINGCKYLAGKVNPDEQKPNVINSLREFTKENIAILIVGIIALMILVLGIFFTRKSAFD